MLITPISIFPRCRGKRFKTLVVAAHVSPQKNLPRWTSQPKRQALIHRRDAKFTEVGLFFDQELFTRRPQRLSGEFSSGSIRALGLKSRHLQSVKPFRVVGKHLLDHARREIFSLSELGHHILLTRRVTVGIV